MEQLLSGKNVLISGVGANIGRSIALEMAAQGAAIYFFDKDETCCTALQKELTELQVLSRGWTLDISKSASIKHLQRDFAKDNIHIDVLVNNVGVSWWHLYGEQEEGALPDFEKWRTLFDTNVFGPMILTDWVSQNMIAAKRGGCILFLSTIHQSTYKGDASYSSSKAAVGALINELALKLAPHGIRVNGLAPGLVVLDDGAPRPHAPTPLHQTSVDPCYIGRAAVYLASDYFSHCTTGTLLKIDAGLSLVNYVSMLPQPSVPRNWVHKVARHYRHQWRSRRKR
jgi:NAD(P)-dependent dehydrogenase (short-subunit alcohol dehydrogenase family)